MNKISVEIEVSKLHVALLSIVLLLASVSATVDLKDTLEMYGPIQMNDNAIKGLDSPESPQDAATKKYVDSNSGLGYSDKRYDYSRAYQLSGNSIRCDPFETLVDVTCHYAGSGGIDNQNNVPVKCDSRTRRSATQGGGLGGGGAIGTCLPPNGVKSQVFGQPESTNTFQIPPWADELSFEITGGNGGDGYASGGEGGLVNATILVGGTDEVRVYLGENGGSGSLGPDYNKTVLVQEAREAVSRILLAKPTAAGMDVITVMVAGAVEGVLRQFSPIEKGTYLQQPEVGGEEG
nr:MAG: hypothetical protein J07AB56_13300 [Candidatus Nanosalinarum sp. J07AB56]